MAATNFGLRQVSHYLLYFGLALSAIGWCIMLLSFAYFLPRSVCGKRAGAWQRANALVVFAGWLVIVGSVVLIAFPGLAPGYPSLGATSFASAYATLMLLSLPHFLLEDKRPQF